MRRFLVLFAFVATPVFGQTATPMTPLDQALSNKVMVELNAGLQCSAGLIDTQKQLADAQAQLKALKDKYEPAKTN